MPFPRTNVSSHSLTIWFRSFTRSSEPTPATAPRTQRHHACRHIQVGSGSDGADNGSAYHSRVNAIVARFSNSTGLPAIPDNAPKANPRGFAIRFNLAEHVHTDIVSHSTDGFPTRDGYEFLEFLQAAAASGPDVPRPSRSRSFLPRIPPRWPLCKRQSPSLQASPATPISVSPRSGSPMTLERRKPAAIALCLSWETTF